MSKKNRFKNIAVLIDADNVQASAAAEALDRISNFGRICLKRAYGNWSKTCLSAWKPVLKENGIKAEEQVDYVTGKSATDMQMIVQAMDLLHAGVYDAFAIVSGDSDFTPLATRIRESGTFVICAGKKDTPMALRNAVDCFFELKAEKEEKTPEMERVFLVLKEAQKKYEEEDGFTNVCVVSQSVRESCPEFSLAKHGWKKWTDLIKAYPSKFEMKTKSGKGGATIVEYRTVA